MPGMPAKCTNCGHVFESPIYIEGVKEARLSANIATCPECGHAAKMVEGTFSVRDGVIEALQATDFNRDLLNELAALGEQVKSGELDYAEAEGQLAEASSAIAKLLARTPEAAKKAVIWALLQVLVILASQGLNELREDSVSPSDLERALHRQDTVLEQRLERAVEASFEAEEKQSSTGEQRSPSRVGRNDPRPCRSGKKYKKCCGQ